MKRYLSLGGAVALLLLLPPAVRADVGDAKDTADLLPASSLAYLELRHPNQLAREAQGLIKGSMLENLPAALAKWRLEHPTNQWWYLQEVAIFSVFASPETLAEGGRLGGAAIAVTGFDKNFEPEVVGIVLAGDSNAPTFIMRMALSMMQVRILETVNGVPLYRSFSEVYEPPAAPGQPGRNLPADWNGPVLAMLPDAIVVGSSQASVKDVVLRYQGKTVAPALSSVAAFKDSGKLRELPGLFAYADTVALTNLLDKAKDKPLGMTEYEWSILKAIVSPKSTRSVTASLTINRGDLELYAQVILDSRESSPLLRLLPDKPTNPQLLHAVPADSLAALTFDLGDGAKRWQEIVTLADAIARIGKTPEEFWPGKLLPDMEKKVGLQFGKDVAAKIEGVALAFEPRQNGPVTVLVLEAVDEAAAKDLEKATPKLLGLVAGEDLAASRETVQGIPIGTLPGDKLPWHTALSYGRQGAVLVFAPDRKAVLEALQGAEKKAGLLGKQKVATALKGVEGSVAVGVWSLGESLVQMIPEIEHSPLGGPNFVPPGGAQPKPASDFMQQYVKRAAALVQPLPPAVITLTRKNDALTLKLRQPQLRTVSAKLIDTIVEASLESSYRRVGGPGNAAPVPAAPAAPPPPPPAPEKKPAEKKPPEKKPPEKDK